MKWGLKFSTKGKGAHGNFKEPQVSRSNERSIDNPDQGGDDAGTPAVTPPDAANNNNTSGGGDNGNGGRRLGEKATSSAVSREKGVHLEKDEEEQVEQQSPIGNNGGAAVNGKGHNTSSNDNGFGAEENCELEDEGDGEDGWGDMDGENELAEARRGRGQGGRHQDDVFDDDSQEDQGDRGEEDDEEEGDADSLHAANKMARIRSFADDPEGHNPNEGDWDGTKEESGEEEGGRQGSPRVSRTGGAGSHSYHSEARSGEHAGTEEYNSNTSPDHQGAVDKRNNNYTSFGGMSGGGVSLVQSEGEILGGRLEEEDEEDEDDEDEGQDADLDGNERHQHRHRHTNNGSGLSPGDSGGGGGGGGGGGVNRRAHAHAYADEPDDMSRETPGYLQQGRGTYGSGGAAAADLHHRSGGSAFPPPPPQGGEMDGPDANGLSAVDARTAASLASRTRLAAGGSTRPESGVGIAAGQAAAAAAAALRRGPTPGSHSLPSMVLVPLEALKAHRRVPRSSDRKALVRYRDLPDRSRCFVVFVSHAWMRPHTTPSFAHPDTSSRGGEKYRLIAEAGDRIRAHLPPDVRVLLWIDYSCVDQDSTRRSKATMRGMREYMRRCDAILTVYPGDAADNGEEFLPNRFVKSCSWAGSYKSLAHYCTRGWCRLEMLLGQTEPLPQDGFMFNFLVPKKKKASGAKASVGDRPHFLYGAHQRPHSGRIDVVPRQSSRWFEEHHPEQGNFTHESDRDAIRAVLAKQTSTMAKKSAAIAARYGTDPRRGGGGNSSSAAATAAAAGNPGGGRHSPGVDPSQQHFSGGEYGIPH